MRAVLLDAMGTLLRLEPPAPRLVEELRDRHGIELSLTDAERAFGGEIAYYRAHHHEGRDPGSLLDLRMRCAEILRGELGGEAAARMSGKEMLEVLLGALHFEVFPEVPEVLGALRARGSKLAVVSDWDVSLAGVLDSVGVGALVDTIVTSAEVGRAKPDPGVFRVALERLGVDREMALHVGDSPDLDVVGARAAEVTPVLLCRELLPEGDLRGEIDPPSTRDQPPIRTELAGVRVISSLRELLDAGLVLG